MRVAKLIINEQDIAVNCMKTRKELEETITDTITNYKEIIFGVDSPVCMERLNEL